MNRKKKTAAILLTAALGLTLSACGGLSRESAGVPSAASAAESEASSSMPTTSAEPAADGGTLVVYFSCTGNTKAAAQTIANASNGALYEITPAQPYGLALAVFAGPELGGNPDLFAGNSALPHRRADTALVLIGMGRVDVAIARFQSVKTRLLRSGVTRDLKNSQSELRNFRAVIERYISLFHLNFLSAITRQSSF
jgi:hypothetical protein